MSPAMEWLLSLLIIALALFVMPWAIGSAKRSTRGKGGAAGAALGIGTALTAILEPTRAAASETIQKHAEIGDAEHDVAGDGSQPG